MEKLPEDYAVLGVNEKFPVFAKQLELSGLRESVGEKAGKKCEKVEYKGLTGYLVTIETAQRLLSLPNKYFELISEKPIEIIRKRGFDVDRTIVEGRKILDESSEIQTSLDDYTVDKLRALAEEKNIALEATWRKPRIKAEIVKFFPEFIIGE